VVKDWLTNFLLNHEPWFLDVMNREDAKGAKEEREEEDR
jgi:hypothetical protein